MRIKYNKTIAFDIDGLIADFEGEFCDRFGYENRHLHNLCDRYPEVDRGLIEEFVSSPSSYENLFPIFGGILMLRQARERGFFTLLLTSRPKRLAEVTTEWLENYDLPYHELWFASNGKAEAIREFNQIYPNRKVMLLVDDTVSNLTGLPDGVDGLAWEQPWNVGYYPRAHYNDKGLFIEIQASEGSTWKKF